MKIGVVAACMMATGCFDSLVSDPCATGFTMSNGSCVLEIGPDGGQGGPDGGQRGPDGGQGGPDAGPIVDATMPDALTCPAPMLTCGNVCIDGSSDPNNCGRCGRTCASGICEASVCVGDVVGHIVAIGHDYRSYHAAMARVLANAIALGASPSLHVGFYAGTANEVSADGTRIAAAAALAVMGRTHTDLSIDTITDQTLSPLDVIVVDAQTGDGDTLDALGATWSVPLANFFGRGGVAVVLDGVNGTSYRAAHGAGLYDVTAPVDATSQQVTVVDGTDAVTQQVPSPYLAETTSVSFPGTAGAIENSGGDAVVFHIAR
jgi:hypothetical protein